MTLSKRGSWALLKDISRSDRTRTVGVGGPTQWTIERKPRWLKHVGLHVLGHPCWRSMACPSRMMPRLGIIVGGMPA